MSTPNNYIDLIGQITERLDVPCGNIRLGIHEALAYLDRYPSQAPGRTITQSRLRELTDQYHSGAVYSFSHWLDELGIVEVPDPEPPESVPGRTITESELRRIAEDSAGPGASTVMPYIKATVEALGIPIVDDPKPTNAQKLEALLEGGDINAQWGLRGGGVMFARELAHALDEAGVKAPGGGE